MSSCFYNLDDDIYEYERHASRLHQIKNAFYIDSIAKLNHISELETRMRTEEDMDVLDTLIETQGLLQQTVSHNYDDKNTSMMLIWKYMLNWWIHKES